MSLFSAHQISEHVYWVGAIDWNLRDFHGYKTSRGTTYNAYLILGEKPILIDTVKAEFYEEMISRISSIIDPKKIEVIISNHAEMDHSGSLPKAIQDIAPEKIYASKAGVQTLKENLLIDDEITAIENGASFSIGDSHFACIETKMLHWPDSMLTYFANDKILFSQDGFGMHLATDQLFADQHPSDILKEEAGKYFANILLPYTGMVTNLLKKLPSFNLDIQMIAPDHGPIWNTPNLIQTVIQWWAEWSEQRSYKKAVIVYDTMWKSTEKMAIAIEEGLMSQGVACQVMPLSSNHRSDIAHAVLEAGALIVGSPVINQEIFPTVADCMTYLKGLGRKNLIGQVFSSYGWADKASLYLTEWFNKMKINLVGEKVTSKYAPDEKTLEQCRKLGETIAITLKQQEK